MKRALVLSAVNPKISGVLFQGVRGTEKSTVIRVFDNLLPKRDAVADCLYGRPLNIPE